MPLRSVFLVLALSALGCHAQLAAKAPGGSASAGETLSPAMARRIEVLIRSKSDIPLNYVFRIGPVGPSDVPGYDSVTAEFSVEGKSSKPLVFLLSKDRKTLAQFSKFDVSKDPKLIVSGTDRPSRGGSADAPVLIVVFDDLECPFCARSNANLFPAVIDRYKSQVRIVYRDFPLDIHPWAMRGAIDTNCVASQSVAGYWNLIDYIHVHENEIGGTEKTVTKANEMLDNLARDEGKRQKIDETKLNACIVRQDTAPIKQSMNEAEALGVGATPALFINGEKVEGAQPMEYIYRIIDGALVAAGQTPPPPPTPPGAIPGPAPAQTKPGN